MRFILLVIVILLFIIISGYLFWKNNLSDEEEFRENQTPEAYKNTSTMKITSSAFQNNGSIPSKYTCDGLGINPPLGISNVPPETKSLVVIVDDPDVPKNVRLDGVWDHWVVFNISPAKTEISEKEVGFGISGSQTGGKLGYLGPCPPNGEHRYYFRLYALDSELNLSQGATKSQVIKAMAGHILTETELVGRYERRR